MVGAILDAIDQVLVGKRAVAHLMLCAVLANGHILLQDVPGVGKTRLAKTLAQCLDLGFARVQCTPDLLPSDLVGTHIYDPARADFRFYPGPVFTHLLLVDEINRASPRTQSALLEVMEERQVTLDGTTRTLEAPFLVVATENPLEFAGAYPLPEAQLDRFLLRLSLGYPEPAAEVEMLRRARHRDPAAEVRPLWDRSQLLALQEEVRRVDVEESILQYVQRLVAHTRRHPALLLGASPRAALALLRTAQALAWTTGRSYVIPDDIRRLLSPVLSHRLIPRGHDETAGEAVLEELAHLPPPGSGQP